MNLKESFRYQKFLDSMMTGAAASLRNPAHCLVTVKKHLRNAVNPEAQDEEETVDNGEFTSNDTVMEFMSHLVDEREKLSNAIGKAKAGIGFDMDAAIETNKFRQAVNSAIRQMMQYSPNKRKTQELGYKFDVNGVQQAYRYDVEVTTTENYDKAAAKSLMRGMIEKADAVSADVDAAMINTTVDYEPPYNVNDSFDDVMEAFIKSREPQPEQAEG